jgi:hypothetical protein
MVMPVEIVNGTLNVIVEEIKDSVFTIILSLATLGLAIVTGLSLWKTSRHTQEQLKQMDKSNSLLEEQIRNSRPILSIEDVEPRFVTLSSGFNVMWEEVTKQKINPEEIQKVLFEAKIRNVGGNPTLFVEGKAIISKNPLKQSDLRNMKTETSFPLLVNQAYPITFPISGSDFINSNKNPIYTGIELTYKIREEEFARTGKIWQIQFGQGLILDTWFEEKLRSM